MVLTMRGGSDQPTTEARRSHALFRPCVPERFPPSTTDREEKLSSLFPAIPGNLSMTKNNGEKGKPDHAGYSALAHRYSCQTLIDNMDALHEGRNSTARDRVRTGSD